MAHQDLLTTDSFLAAAERALDANSASEALKHFLPDHHPRMLTMRF